MLRCELLQDSLLIFKWFVPQLGGLEEVEERVGDLEAEHDYLMEVEASLHSTSSKQQQVHFDFDYHN